MKMKTKLSSIQKGFTVAEVIIVVAVIGILAAVSIPVYSDYTNKTKAISLMSLSSPAMVWVELCVEDKVTDKTFSGVITGCSYSKGGNLRSLYADSDFIKSALISDNGEIKISYNEDYLKNKAGTEGATYTLTPSADSKGVVTWTKSGSVVTDGYIKQ